MAKKKTEEVVLEETKGTFQLRGKVVGTESERFYAEEEIKRGKHEGTPSRRINFGIQTSPTSKVYVGMFGMEPEKVFLWNSNKKKGDFVEYDEWLAKHEQWAEKGLITFDTNIQLEWEDEDEPKDGFVAKHLTRYDGAEYLYETLEEGMSVEVRGSISYNSYENRDGDTVVQKQFNIEQVFRQRNEIDFEAEDFTEKALFTQSFVSEDVEILKDEKKAIVYGKVLNYHKVAYGTTFEIDFSEDEDLEEMAKIMKKEFKFGTLAEGHGVIANRALVVEDDSGAKSGMLGKKNKMASVRGYERVMSLLGIESYTLGKYDEDDFTVENEDILEEAPKKNKSKGLGAKKAKDDKEKGDPFGSASQIDIDDDDLPF